jgi:hypothetical protein
VRCRQMQEKAVMTVFSFIGPLLADRLLFRPGISPQNRAKLPELVTLGYPNYPMPPPAASQKK